MNAHTYTAPTISAGTITRTAVLLLALTNQILSACGKPVLPIESTTVEQLVTTGLTVTAALVNWWKNNSFTPEAIKADGYLEQLRDKIAALDAAEPKNMNSDAYEEWGEEHEALEDLVDEVLDRLDELALS